MNREEIIKLAREAGSIDSEDVIETVYAAFAAAAVEREREACAKLLDERAAEDKWTNYYAVAAKAIRARGETTSRGNE